jgi:hypothetical protein
MRNILLFFAIIIMATACKKEACEDAEGEGLAGKWILRQTLVSPGPIGEWKSYWGPVVSLTFRDDGTLGGPGWPDSNDPYDRYEVNGNYITFYQNSSTDSLRRGYKLKGNELYLWNPSCFEPCGSKYKRVQ